LPGIYPIHHCQCGIAIHQLAKGNVWEDPPCLEEWEEAEPGLYQGRLHGLEGVRDGSLTVTVEHDLDAVLAAGDTVSDSLDGARRYVRTRTGELFQLGLPAGANAEEASSDTQVSLQQQIERLPAAASAAAGFLGPPLIVGTALLTASAIGYMVLGHHHVDVSVFIV